MLSNAILLYSAEGAALFGGRCSDVAAGAPVRRLWGVSGRHSRALRPLSALQCHIALFGGRCSDVDAGACSVRARAEP